LGRFFQELDNSTLVHVSDVVGPSPFVADCVIAMRSYAAGPAEIVVHAGSVVRSSARSTSSSSRAPAS